MQSGWILWLVLAVAGLAVTALAKAPIVAFGMFLLFVTIYYTPSTVVQVAWLIIPGQTVPFTLDIPRVITLVVLLALLAITWFWWTNVEVRLHNQRILVITFWIAVQLWRAFRWWSAGRRSAVQQ